MSSPSILSPVHARSEDHPHLSRHHRHDVEDSDSYFPSSHPHHRVDLSSSSCGGRSATVTFPSPNRSSSTDDDSHLAPLNTQPPPTPSSSSSQHPASSQVPHIPAVATAVAPTLSTGSITDSPRIGISRAASLRARAAAAAAAAAEAERKPPAPPVEEPLFTQIDENLWLSGAKIAQSEEWLRAHNIHAIVNAAYQDGVPNKFDRSFGHQLALPSGTTTPADASGPSSGPLPPSSSLVAAKPSDDDKTASDNDLSITYLPLNVFDADAPGDHSNIAKYFPTVIEFIEKHRHRSSSRPTSSSGDKRLGCIRSASGNATSATSSTSSETNGTLPSSSSAMLISSDTAASCSSSSSSALVSSRRGSLEGSSMKGGVLVHCHSGVSRAPSLILSWLISVRGWSLNASLEWLRERRPQIRPNNGFMRQLIEFERSVTGSTSLNIDDYPPPIVMGP